MNATDGKAMDDVQQETAVASTCHCPKWSLRPRQWLYRGEGNASLVLALPQVIHLAIFFCFFVCRVNTRPRFSLFADVVARREKSSKQ